MMPNFLLFDDDEYVIAELKIRLRTIGNFTYYIAHDVPSALAILKAEVIDLAILDIEVPGNSLAGIQVAAYIAEYTPALPFIFLSGYPAKRYATYQLSPLAFVGKPLDDNLIYAVELAMEGQQLKVKRNLMSKPNSSVFYLPDRSGHVRLDVASVYYAFADQKCTTIRTKEGDITIHASIKFLLEQLGTSQLIKISRSHAINLDYLERYDHEGVVIKGEKLLASKRGVALLESMLHKIENKP